ncbi:MAG: tRNA preQ1(34) S-adenosylmethionine ribosyltransferase-isomerase QueA [Desulfobacterales bacterium]
MRADIFSLSEYDYRLPPERIAQTPAARRDSSRLLVLSRENGTIAHRDFNDLLACIERPDILVVNNTEVIPARLVGRKTTGGKVEVLILDYAGGRTENGRFVCRCLVKAHKPPRTGSVLFFDGGLRATVLDGAAGDFRLAFDCDGAFEFLLYQIGQVPLPPYIHRESGVPLPEDRQDYQTVYAEEKGAVAAPTAGLHFSRDLLEDIRAKGVDIVTITLHVGYGTFMPVRVDDIRRHRIHAERFRVTPAAADRINRAKAQGGRLIAVGTTCVRTLEFSADDRGHMAAGSGICDLFIYPGYRFKAIDGMVTNFHLPKSTLLMLVAAFAGRERILTAYQAAIEAKYRFFSYGDAMLII